MFQTSVSTGQWSLTENTEKANPAAAPAYCLESFQHVAQAGQNPVVFLRWGGGPGRLRQLVCPQKSMGKGKLHRNELWRSARAHHRPNSLSCPPLQWSLIRGYIHIRGNYLRLGKGPPKGSRMKTAGTRSSWRSHHPSGWKKPNNKQGMGCSPQRVVLLWKQNKFSTRLKVSPDKASKQASNNQTVFFFLLFF